MLTFLLRRLIFAIVLVVAVSSAALLLARMAPGDVTTQLGPFASPAEIAEARARYDLDRSPTSQLGLWLSRAARFDFGNSFLYNRPVRPLSDELRRRFMQYEWPGNIRELENMIKRFVILQDEQMVVRELEKPRVRPNPAGVTPPSAGWMRSCSFTSIAKPNSSCARESRLTRRGDAPDCRSAGWSR